jgi:hypothetical protein
MKPVVMQVVPAAAQRVLCRGDPSHGTLFSCLPQYPWRLSLTAFNSLPKIISRWFSFEEPQYFHSKCTENMQWEGSLRVGETLSEYS